VKFSRRSTILFTAWLSLIAAGFRYLVGYELTAGIPAASVSQWPEGAPVSLDPERYNLVMLLHPRCACSEASLTELVNVLSRAGNRVKASVLVYSPGDSSPEWVRGALWKSAEEIPGVQVAADPDGKWAQAFGATTSGTVVVFDRAGHVRFQGGITGARGHEGPNSGEQAVLAELLAGSAPVNFTPVFGCEIVQSNPAPGRAHP
jgi:hypothetical protein